MAPSSCPPPPHDPSTAMMQVVDYEETFNSDLEFYLQRHGISSRGFNYHVAAIMGPQSSGKSTLMNMLFGTSFRTMEADAGRYQVTQGVWLGHDPHAGIVVMDLEGTDSRERGEDAASFERKSSLFALALAEVLIINVWTQDVGRYNAANLALLKTILELDMQLFFGASSHTTPQDPANHKTPRMHKTRLLFVLRDHYAVAVGGTPFDRLQSILTADVDKIWNTIAKPDAAVGTPLSDYFDLDFFALPHKVLEPEQFLQDGQALKQKFNKGEMFRQEYSRGVAADGFAAYAQSVWETVRANKELDIPTQKEMLAHVRCEQIARDALVTVDKTLEPIRLQLFPADGAKVIPVSGLYATMLFAVESALQAYEESAGRYFRAVADMKAQDLHMKLTTDCKALYDAQGTAVSDTAVAEFRKSTREFSRGSTPWNGWGARSRDALDNALDVFDSNCQIGAVDLAPVSANRSEHPLAFAPGAYANARKRLQAVLKEEVERATRDASSKAREECLKTFQSAFKSPLAIVLDNAREDVWERASEVANTAWETTKDFAVTVYGVKGLGLDESAVEVVVEDELKPDCYEMAVTDMKETLGTPSNFLLRMTKRFDDKFRFDERGVPRHYGPDENLETLFIEAREDGEKLVDILAEVKLTGTLTRMRASSRELDRKLMHPTVFEKHLQLDLRDKLHRQASAVFVEAKRAQEAAKITTRIPMWLFALLVILGWNEIMMVLRNPVLLVLSVVVLPVVYFSYMMDAPTLLVPAVRTAAAPYLRIARDLIDQYVPHDADRGTLSLNGSPGAGADVSASSITEISKND